MFVMPDEDFLNLEHTVQTHEAELDRISKEITALMDDLKVLIECDQGLGDQIRHRARHNVPSDPDEFVERCRSFLNRHGFSFTP
jgi:hypothetical protein